jgi:hypothetical protein
MSISPRAMRLDLRVCYCFVSLIGDPPSTYIGGWVSGNRLGLQIRQVQTDSNYT